MQFRSNNGQYLRSYYTYFTWNNPHNNAVRYNYPHFTGEGMGGGVTKLVNDSHNRVLTLVQIDGPNHHYPKEFLGLFPAI